MDIIRIIVSYIVRLMDLMIFARVIMSFVPDFSRNPIGRFVYGFTEPLLAPIRRIMPNTGMIDFSPLVLLLILSFIQRLI